MNKKSSVDQLKFEVTFKALEQAMAKARTGKKFKSELENALLQGFSIDYIYSDCIYRYDGADSIEFKDTLLHKSMTMNTSASITQILLDYGADVNIEDHNGMNALLIATYHNEWDEYIPYYDEILEKTTDIDKLPHRLVRTTALGILCSKYCTQPSNIIWVGIRKLIDAGADIEASGDWISNYYGEMKKKYYKNGERLKSLICSYIERKDELKTTDGSYYDYEL